MRDKMKCFVEESKKKDEELGQLEQLIKDYKRQKFTFEAETEELKKGFDELGKKMSEIGE